MSSAIQLYARATTGHAERVAHAVALLQAAAREHAGRIVLASSLGAEDMVLTDLIARHRLPIAIGTLETGKQHAQTLALVQRTEQRYGLRIELHRPRSEAVMHFVRNNGNDAMYRSIELRKACCALRKLEPLERMLADRSAWVTGLRREQSGTRSEVPYNPLHDEFMPSIGCEPCTRAIAVGEDFRSGRWWWEDESTKECGLHVKSEDAVSALPLRAQNKTAQGASA
jgi:phosphoadenosine phosphosulfate reductase